MPKLDPDTMRMRRQHIIDAAIRQFARRGFGGASVDDICAEAKISKGALYTHFESKEAIMLEMIRQRGTAYAHIEAASLEALETVIFDMLLRGLSYVDSRLEMEAVTIGASNDAIRAALTENSALCEAGIRRVIETLLAAGKVRMVDGITPAEASVLIHTYILGRLSRQIYETDTLDAEAQRGLRITFNGLMRDTG